MISSTKVYGIVVSSSTAHHFLLPLVVRGDNFVGLMCGFSAGRADADVVIAAVDLQEALVFLTDLLLQVEGGFNQTMRRQGLYLQEKLDMSIEKSRINQVGFSTLK